MYTSLEIMRNGHREPETRDATGVIDIVLAEIIDGYLDHAEVAADPHESCLSTPPPRAPRSRRDVSNRSVHSARAVRANLSPDAFIRGRLSLSQRPHDSLLTPPPRPRAVHSPGGPVHPVRTRLARADFTDASRISSAMSMSPPATDRGGRSFTTSPSGPQVSTRRPRSNAAELIWRAV